jgi:hypothetical protein
MHGKEAQRDDLARRKIHTSEGAKTNHHKCAHACLLTAFLSTQMLPLEILANQHMDFCLPNRTVKAEAEDLTQVQKVPEQSSK